MKRYQRVAVAVIFVAQIACLAIVASRNWHMLNPDAVSYLEITRHLLRGEFALTVNGYWGPLISWVAVPFLAATHDPLLTARCAMVISALVFSSGALAYFSRSKLPFAAVWIATAVCAFVTIYWSVSDITPDLLADGLLFIGFAGVSDPDWPRDRSRQIRSGLFLGLAYLAKAVMLPLGIASVLAIALHQVIRHRDASGQSIGAAMRTMIAIAIVALPWIVVLSVHYRKPVFSTAGPIAHALVGPNDVDRRNPLILSFHHPAAGRVTDSEDPNPAAFRGWSPFASRDYLQWQRNLIRENATKIWNYVDQFTRWHIGAIALLLALLIAIVRPKWCDIAPSLLAAVPILIAAAMYASVFADSARYYILAYALMLGAAGAIPCAIARRVPLLAILTTAIVAAAIILPARIQFTSAFSPLPNHASTAAIDLARRMKSSGAVGPIAGTGPIDAGMGGLYTAFLLDVPWCGDEPQPHIDTLRSSGARYWILGTDDREKLKSIPPDATRDVTARVYGADMPNALFVIREVAR